MVKNLEFRIGDEVDLLDIFKSKNTCIACLFRADNNPDKVWTWYNADLGNVDIDENYTSVLKVDEILYNTDHSKCILIGNSTAKGEFVDGEGEYLDDINDALNELDVTEGNGDIFMTDEDRKRFNEVKETVLQEF